MSLLVHGLSAQTIFNRNGKTEYTDFDKDTLMLEQVEVNAQNGARLKAKNLTSNTEIIGTQQLVRAACCNLGESFTTNPSVDVNYSDAATGARQIKLLGLSGTYVQMLTENIPNLRGASIPYSLGYVPGPWMQAIQVSKGASSVKNGYESTTGQINIEFQKPQGIDGVRGNLYYDTQQKFEANADASVHLTDELSTSLLLHYEDRQKDHDGNNDGFMDMPKQRQYNVMHRWAYVSPKFISQLSARILYDKRESGQSLKHHNPVSSHPYYGIDISTHRYDGQWEDDERNGEGKSFKEGNFLEYEGQWKNAIILDPDHNASIALMLHGSIHDSQQNFGYNLYNVNQKNGYAQLMYESDLTERHNLSVGASLNHDYYMEDYISEEYMKNIPYTTSHNENVAPAFINGRNSETTAGVYAQYTYKLDEMLTLMGGVRYDYSDRYGSFFTPRVHIKYSPNEIVTLRASAGKGYRTPHALAENMSMLASGRIVHFNKQIDENLKQEEAWNYGASLGFDIPIGEKNLELNAEYYYTDFKNQMVVNVTNPSEYIEPNVITTADKNIPGTVWFENLNGKSYSHTIQVDATYPLFEGLSATAAYRFNDVKCTYDGILRWKPLTSRYKGLLTLSYKTPLELWQIDVTGQIIGPSELYDGTRSPSYGLLNAQLTREFRYFSVYVGGENLTGYKMKNPIIGANDPYSPQFDATQVWGPTEGAMGYIGIRFKFEKL